MSSSYLIKNYHLKWSITIAMPLLHELTGVSTYVFILAIVKFTREAFQSYTGCMRVPSHLLLL